MKRMKIRRALNLDNVRCFLYGPGQNDDCGELTPGSSAVLSKPIGECGPIQDRAAFLDLHFGPEFAKYARERYLSDADTKIVQEFFMELCDRRSSKRGTVTFLDTMSASYLCGTDPFSLEHLIKTNIRALAGWDISSFDQQLLAFIDILIEVENHEGTNPKHAAVSHFLQSIRNTAAINACTQASPESRARTLSLLLLGALLREKFPLPLLSRDAFHLSESQRYQIGNVFAAVQVNLSLLSSQLTTQEKFLQEAVRIFDGFVPNGQPQSPMLRALEEYYALQLWHLARAADMADYTSIADELEASSFPSSQNALCFLHGAAFHMDGFAKAGMGQFMDYLTIVTSSRTISFSGPAVLAHRYRECLTWFRRLAYWYIVSVCQGMPYEITRDMDVIAGYLNPDGSASFPVHIKMDCAEIQSKMETTEQQFRSMLSAVSDKNVMLVFPDIFCRPGFPLQIAYEPYQKRTVRLLKGECSIPENAIIDVFFSQFSQMDDICDLQRHMLKILTGIANLPPDEADKALVQVRGITDQYRQLMQQLLDIPPAVVTKPLQDYMYRKGIKRAEFQNFCATVYSLARDNLRYLDMFEYSLAPEAESYPMREELHTNAVSSLETTIAWLGAIPNYWFAGWDKEALTYLRAKCEHLHVLSINWEAWSNTLPGAERGMAKVLDGIEDKLHQSERDLSRKTWDLMALKLEIEQMVASLPGNPTQAQ